MTSFYGAVISDAALVGYPNQAVLSISENAGKIYWQLTATGGIDDSRYTTALGYGLTLGTTDGGADIANVSTNNTPYTPIQLRSGGTLTSGSATVTVKTIYYNFSEQLGTTAADHLTGNRGSMEISNPSPTLAGHVTIDCFGLEAGTTSELFATWTWNKEHTKEFSYVWDYYAGDQWFRSSGTTIEHVSKYSIPSNATMVRFAVIPVSETYSLGDNSSTEMSYWLGEYSTYKTYNVSETPPSTPSTPTIEIDKYTLTVSLDNLDTSETTTSGIHANQIEFQIVKDDTTVFNTGIANIVLNKASYSCSVSAGANYKVRARSKRGTLTSSWSSYSSNVKTIPAAPTGITTIRAASATSIYVEWPAVQNATSYNIQYANKLSAFDGSDGTTKETGITTTHYLKEGLSAGEYFFRVSATNSAGESEYTDIKSITIGKAPSAPTTWSSSTTIVVNSPLILYWIHNAKDGSSQTYAQLEMTVNGVTATKTIQNSTEEDLKDKTSSYSVDTSSYSVGAKIQWRVRTAGIVSTEFGDWSVMREVDIYAPVTLSLSLTNSSGTAISTLTSFPFYINGTAGPATQAPVGYHISVTSNEYYETVDEIGTQKIVNAGEEIFAKYYNSSKVLKLEMSASNIDLQNNISYTVTVTVSMNSGLTATSSVVFNVAWVDGVYYPNAEIGIDTTIAAAYIRPYCLLSTGALASGVTMSVYRREFDGSFTEIATGINNTKLTFVTDPHPSLDLARYRIVATETSTGAVSYTDTPGVPTKELGAIIQWNEEWSNFQVSDATIPVKPAWSGSFLRLLYNVDVSDDNSVESSLVKYVGRKHPVSYYGTQIEATSSWKMDVVKTDKETIYQLRRLAVWPGNVYVREPSGTGYWATIKVTFDLTHAEVLVPVTLDITRVEGGI